VQGAAHLFFPVLPLIQDLWRALGILPIGVGVAVMLLADRQFKEAETTVQPFDPPSTLVTGGTFRFSRNPMYLGMVLVLAGMALALGTLTPFLVPPVLAWVFTRRFIIPEEAAMERAFGREYEDYRRRVRRWL
jgi:protein-S-isoprenylcysteine O-methyltransferase Ste14